MSKFYEIFEAEKENLIKRLRAHPFLARCRNGEMTLTELKVFLIQQGLYSTYFTRYLCAMMANLPGNPEVLALAGNLFEELGFAKDSPTPHSLIYRDMLSEFGLSLNNAVPTEGTSNLIDTMFQFCKKNNPAFGLGALCLGAEALVPALYSDIIAGFEHIEVAKDKIAFFHIHVECDDGHAETIQRIMLDVVERDAQQLQNIVSAGQALVDARIAFFSSLDLLNKGKATDDLLEGETFTL